MVADVNLVCLRHAGLAWSVQAHQIRSESADAQSQQVAQSANPTQNPNLYSSSQALQAHHTDD